MFQGPTTCNEQNLTQRCSFPGWYKIYSVKGLRSHETHVSLEVEKKNVPRNGPRKILLTP